MTPTPSGSAVLPLDAAGRRDGTGQAAHGAALSQLAAASEHLALDDGLHQMLATPRRSMTVAVPVRRDDGSVQVVRGYRVQHNLSKAPRRAASALPRHPHRQHERLRILGAPGARPVLDPRAIGRLAR